MTINILELVGILRLPMLHDTAKTVLTDNGFTPEYKEKQLKEHGITHLTVAEDGIELAFSERRSFEADFAPAMADGDAIFTCIFIYPNGTREYGEFKYQIGYGIDDCRNRSDALKKLGSPQLTEEDDGLIEWDRWIIGEHLSIRADYDDNQGVRTWTIGVPMKL
jgi:hypothetical protein